MSAFVQAGFVLAFGVEQLPFLLRRRAHRNHRNSFEAKNGEYDRDDAVCIHSDRPVATAFSGKDQGACKELGQLAKSKRCLARFAMRFGSSQAIFMMH
jgi:hypothetical protein